MSLWVKPDLVRADPVDVDLHRRVIRMLPDKDVHRARQPGDRVAAALGRSGSSASASCAADLHVDRRGQTEIEDLTGDVRRLEEEGLVGKSRGQVFPELPRVESSVGLMLRL